LVKEADALWCFLTDRIDDRLIAAGSRLKIIANCAAGVNNVDLKVAEARGIMVANTPGVLTDATADLTWALLLAAVRRVTEGDRFMRAGRFRGWQAGLMLGSDLRGKTLGIVGFGRIGQAVAERGKGFGLRVCYASHPVPRTVEKRLQATRLPLSRLLRTSDILSLHVPLTPTTRHLIGPRELSLMKSTAYLINTARGPVVHERALAEALGAGRLAGAGLDVFEREPQVEVRLKRLSNVVLAPHVGSATWETRARMAELTCRNILEGLAGRRPPCLVVG